MSFFRLAKAAAFVQIRRALAGGAAAAPRWIPPFRDLETQSGAEQIVPTLICEKPEQKAQKLFF
jgi:hypothetical protein